MYVKEEVPRTGALQRFLAEASAWLERANGARAVETARRATSPPSTSGRILRPLAELDAVSVTRGGRPILEDVSLRVEPGEAICLVGPSGGGKSTILNLLAGLSAPTSGAARFRGERIEGPSSERAMVFQDAALFPWLTLEENVAFPLEVAGVARAERLARARELLRLVHLVRFRTAYPHELSGGMRQRGAIARALATGPSLLLFDEPFAALDGPTRELLQAEVERIVKGADATCAPPDGRARASMVFVTHQIDEAVRLGDRVVVLGTRPGRILGEVHVDLTRPRPRHDARLARVAREVAAALEAEVEKVTREEAGDEWVSSRGSAGDDPRRHLGRGI